MADRGIRVTFVNPKTGIQKLQNVPATWDLLLAKASQTLNMDAKYIQTKDGSEIESIDVIRDGDILYFFTNRSASQSYTLGTLSDMLQSPGNTTSQEMINKELSDVFSPSTSQNQSNANTRVIRPNKRQRQSQESAQKIFEKRLVCLKTANKKTPITVCAKNIIADGQISFSTESTELEIRQSILDILLKVVNDCSTSDFEFVRINTKVVTKILTKSDYEWNGRNVASLCGRGALYVQLSKSGEDQDVVEQSNENQEIDDLCQDIAPNSPPAETPLDTSFLEDVNSTDEALLNEVIINSMNDQNLVPAYSDTCVTCDAKLVLSSKWESICTSHDDSDNQILKIRRNHVFDDAIECYSRINFDPMKNLDVRFIGEVGVDAGGPRREFFAIMTKEIQNHLFHGIPGNQVPIHNLSSLRAKKFFIAGIIFAQSLYMDYVGPEFISTNMLSYLISGLDEVTLVVNDIPDEMTRSLVGQLANAQDFQEMFENLLRMEDLLCSAGYAKPMCNVTMSDKDEIVQFIILQESLVKCKAEIDQFSEGLQKMEMLSILKKHTCLRSFLKAPDRKLTSDWVFDLFSYVLSETGSNQRVREDQTLMYFDKYLNDLENNQPESQLTLQEFLCFFSGSRKVPIGGYFPQPELFFDTCHLPTVSTCILKLTLPTNCSDYAEFKKRFDYAITEGGEFGLA